MHDRPPHCDFPASSLARPIRRPLTARLLRLLIPRHDLLAVTTRLPRLLLPRPTSLARAPRVQPYRHPLPAPISPIRRPRATQPESSRFDSSGLTYPCPPARRTETVRPPSPHPTTRHDDVIRALPFPLPTVRPWNDTTQIDAAYHPLRPRPTPQANAPSVLTGPLRLPLSGPDIPVPLRLAVPGPHSPIPLRLSSQQ